MAVGRNPVPLVNIKIGGKWMFIHPKMEPYNPKIPRKWHGSAPGVWLELQKKIEPDRRCFFCISHYQGSILGPVCEPCTICRIP